MASPLEEPSPLAAIPSQLQHLPTAGEKKTNPTKRGVYVPHGFLRPASGLPFLSYRFRGNLAAVVDMSALHTVMLYDIEKGTLLRSFNKAQLRRFTKLYDLAPHQTRWNLSKDAYALAIIEDQWGWPSLSEVKKRQIAESMASKCGYPFVLAFDCH